MYGKAEQVISVSVTQHIPTLTTAALTTGALLEQTLTSVAV